MRKSKIFDSGKYHNDLPQYEAIEYHLYQITNDLPETCKDMLRVQSKSDEHFQLPMDYLYDIIGLASQAMKVHSPIKGIESNDL